MTKHDEKNLPEERPSKSQLKRDMQLLQKIGESLVELSEEQLANIPLESQLRDAILIARSIKAHEGKRRQMQYIGRLMREVDPKPIQDALNNLLLKNQQSKAEFHLIETWRHDLIDQGDLKLQEFLKLYPDVDRQHLRQLIRKAQEDIKSNKNSGANKELFKVLSKSIKQAIARQ